MTSISNTGQEEDFIKLHQQRYIEDVLAAFDMTDANGVATPHILSVKLSKDHNAKSDEEREKMKDKPIRRLVGMLLFLARCTRPDIMTAVTTLARFQTDPGPMHWKWGKNILKYIAGTRDLSIVYGKRNIKKDNHVQYVPLTVYHDSDWAGCADDRRSVTGWATLSFGGPINWCSTKQKCCAQSSCEAEYIASNEAAKESIWSIRLFKDLGYTAEDLHVAQHSSKLCKESFNPAKYLREFPSEPEQAGATPLVQFCDNSAAISNANNAGRFHKRMKHVEVRYHYVRNQVLAGNLKIAKVKTDDNVADILTKGIKREDFEKHRATLLDGTSTK